MMFRNFRTIRSAAFTIIVAALLGACSSMGSLDPFSGNSVNYAAGTPVDGQLNDADRQALAAAVARALDTGEAQNWRGRRAVGSVAPGGYALANLKADPAARMDAARGDLDLAHVVETDLGLYVLTRNSNIRTGPSTDAKAIEVLPSGSGVEVVGRVRDKNWMLISANGAVRGYVFGDLLIKAPGSELELAGGPMRKPILCRKISQRINIYSTRYEGEGAACNDGTGWRPAREPLPDENAPEELIEF
ncbi:SH3 domain-containing protein [Hyphococcus sp.]|uniref:SH3 domain-containing protein n=1 Tax=Hyphococcus sp. TaxID=2038636 RepID=UPI003D11A8EA